MVELISKLGVDWKLLLAQVVNFLLLFFLLQKFAYKPLGEFLKKRAKKIEKGLDDAKKAQEDREKLKVLRTEILGEARKSASEIISEAQVKGQKEFDAALERAKARKEELVKEAKDQIQQEKDDAITSARLELGELVILATQKVLLEKMDEQKDAAMVDKILKEIT